MNEPALSAATLPWWAWAPAALMAAVSALTASVAMRHGRRREAAEAATRDARLAVLALTGRLFEATQGEPLPAAARVAALAERTARALGRPASEIEDLRLAAFVRETERAYEGLAGNARHLHTAFDVAIGLGADAVGRALAQPEARVGQSPEDLLRAALPIADCAGERFDGTGSRGLEGGRLPLASRVLAVAECWDECTVGRPYQQAIGHEAASALLVRERNQRFDPAIVDTFLRAVAGPAEANRSNAA